MDYEAGFNEGERQAFKDARSGVFRARQTPSGEYERGYRDGYTPRSASWALRRPEPAAWWLASRSVAVA